MWFDYYLWVSNFVGLLQMALSRIRKFVVNDCISTISIIIICCKWLSIYFHGSLNNEIHEYWYSTNFDEITVFKLMYSMCYFQLDRQSWPSLKLSGLLTCMYISAVMFCTYLWPNEYLTKNNLKMVCKKYLHLKMN